MSMHVDVVAMPHLSPSYACLLFLVPVSAGYPSPADDYLDGSLDLNQHLITHPTATFFVRVAGESMREAGIHSGDVLIVDRALTPSDGSVVIAAVNGDLTVKRLSKRHGKLVLMPENQQFPPLPITETTTFEVWGVVTYVIHRVDRRPGGASP
jgi:DNA polymerase V